MKTPRPATALLHAVAVWHDGAPKLLVLDDTLTPRLRRRLRTGISGLALEQVPDGLLVHQDYEPWVWSFAGEVPRPGKGVPEMGYRPCPECLCGAPCAVFYDDRPGEHGWVLRTPGSAPPPGSAPTDAEIQARHAAALGIDLPAPRAAVTRAFRAQAKTHHPDAGGAPDAFVALCAARDWALAHPAGF